MKIGNDWPLPISSAPRGRDGCSRQTVSRDRHEDIGSNSHDDQFCVNVLWICLISSEITHTHTPRLAPLSRVRSHKSALLRGRGDRSEPVPGQLALLCALGISHHQGPVDDAELAGLPHKKDSQSPVLMSLPTVTTKTDP